MQTLFTYDMLNYFQKFDVSNIQDNEEPEIENGEEVHEDLSSPLISNLIESLAEVNDTRGDDPLIPGLDNISEPDYNSMDNITLLSTLNLQEPSSETNKEESLLPNFEQ